MTIDTKIEHIDADKYRELEKEAYSKGTRIPKKYSFQIQAILEMVPGDAVVLAHDGYRCRHIDKPNSTNACGIQNLVRKHSQNIIGRHVQSTGYKYESLHVENNQRVAILCLKEGEENGTTRL